MSTVLAKMAVQIAGNTAEFNKAMKDTSSNLKNFTSNIQNMAATVGVAFGVREVASFALEVSKLSGQADAVRTAFERLPNSIRLMNDLKEATGGTVSELELMKRAVQAANFDISLEALPRLLQFATLRAQQTGQSVDYLVDSIVTGIGRKSKLILDNLGISAAQLSAEFNGASLEAQSVGQVAEAVGRIAEKALVNMAGFSENASTKLQRLSANWENLKIKIGDAINESVATDDFNSLFTNLNNQLIVWADSEISIWTKLFSSAKEYADLVKEIEQRQKVVASQAQLNASLIANTGGRGIRDLIGSKESQQQEQTLTMLKDKLKELGEQFDSTDISNKKRLTTIGAEIEATDKLIKKIEELKITAFKSGANLGFTNPVSNLSKSLAEKKTPGIQMPVPGAVDSPFIVISQDVLDANAKAIDEYQRQVEEAQMLRSQFASGLASFITDISESIAQVSRGTISFGDAILRGLSGFMKTFGQQLIALGTAKLGLDKLFTTGFGAPFAIAAGIALVAAAGFVAQNAASGVQSLSGGGSTSSARGSFSGLQTTGGSINVNVTGKIETDGNKMLVIIQNAQQSNLTRRGG